MAAAAGGNPVFQLVSLGRAS